MKSSTIKTSNMEIKNYLLAVLICILLFFSKFVQAQFPAVAPASEGFSDSRLAAIDSMFGEYAGPNHKLPGIVALVARHGKIVFFKAVGYNDIEANKLMKKDDIFRAASQTKVITGVATMILYDEGKILLSDPVSKYIPEFKNPRVLKDFNVKDTTYTTVPAYREVTVRDLLTHSSGISYPVIGNEKMRAIYAKAGIPVGTEPRHLFLADKIKALVKLPLLHQPGEKFAYGLNMDVLGYLIEQVSGMSFNDFLRQKIFDPLRMRDTYFYIPADKQSRLAKVYQTDSTGNTVVFHSSDSSGLNEFYPTVTQGTYYSGGAGLSTTAYDYAVFLQMLANKGIYGGTRILSPAAVRLMTSDQVDEKIKNELKIWNLNTGFGFTVEVITSKGPRDYPWYPGTFFWAGYWGSLGWVDPKAGIVAQIWTQDIGPYKDEVLNKFKILVYSALVKE